jgi:hypothetical protein
MKRFDLKKYRSPIAGAGLVALMAVVFAFF